MLHVCHHLPPLASAMLSRVSGEWHCRPTAAHPCWCECVSRCSSWLFTRMVRLETRLFSTPWPRDGGSEGPHQLSLTPGLLCSTER